VRIAHVTDFYLPRLGGIEMHVSDLALRQVEAGHEVEVITSSPAGGEADRFGAVLVHRLSADLPFAHALHPAAVFSAARTTSSTSMPGSIRRSPSRRPTRPCARTSPSY